MQKIILISIFSISILFSDIGLGTMMDKNKGGISFASNITYLPKKPSSGEPIQKHRTINGSILLSSGLEFLYGKKADSDDNYLGLNYYFKHNNYTISMNFKKYYDQEVMYRPKEIGATLACKIKKQKIVPFVKYSLISSKNANNFELLTFGGYLLYHRLIFSLSYTLPFNEFQGMYNSKGNININTGIYLE